MDMIRASLLTYSKECSNLLAAKTACDGELVKRALRGSSQKKRILKSKSMIYRVVLQVVDSYLKQPQVSVSQIMKLRHLSRP